MDLSNERNIISQIKKTERLMDIYSFMIFVVMFILLFCIVAQWFVQTVIAIILCFFMFSFLFNEMRLYILYINLLTQIRFEFDIKSINDRLKNESFK